MPSGTAAFSTLVLASHNWIYPGRDNGSPGPPLEARQPHPQPQRGVAEALSEPNASLGLRCTRSMRVEHLKLSLILQLLIQERAALTISIAKCYGIFLEKFLLVNMSLLFFFSLDPGKVCNRKNSPVHCSWTKQGKAYESRLHLTAR